MPGVDRRSGAAGRATPRSCSSRAPSGCSAYLLAHYLNFQLYQVLLEAKATEHSARMVAMKNATDNAQTAHQGPDARIQQAAPGQHHQGTAGNHQRPMAMGWTESHEQRQNRSNHRSGRGHRVPRQAAGHLQRAHRRVHRREAAGVADARSAAAPRRQLGARHRHVQHRGAQARLRSDRHRRARSRCRSATASWAACST